MTTNNTKSPKARWETQKAKLKSRFPKLKDEDLNFGEDRIEEMLNHLEPKLAITVDELKLILDSL
jgi:hypothetical protein